MLKYVKSKISDTNPLRLFYHKILAVIAAVYYRFPSKHLNVIGITGTKGKTTTVNLVAGILSEAGYKVGMASTINFKIGDLMWTNASKMTTLGPFFLQKMLRRMVEEQCTHVVLEVSSHALLQNRVWGVNFDTAVITNISDDHLEYHGGFENYLRAKGLLFSRLNRSKRKAKIQKIAVLNKDDANFNYFDQFIADRKYTYGMGGGTCYAGELTMLPSGTKFTLHVPNNTVPVTLGIPGEFNVYNALAAATVGLANNVNVTVLKEALEKASAIPGRFESVECGQKFNTIVDYAHTEESLGNVLSLYRDLKKGRLITVFGATGGGRDKAKRPKMGAVADKYSDYIIVTDDDPYEEDEWEIIEQVSKGISRQIGKNFWQIPDRKEAIRLALMKAKENDTVIVAGKGCEEVIMLRGKRVPWNDKKVIEEILLQKLEIEL